MRVLTQSVTIVEQKAATANRLDIQAFTVDAVGKMVTIAGRGIHIDGDGQVLGADRLPEVRVSGADVYRLMAAGAQYVTVNVLTALGVAPELVAQVVAGCAAHPALASGAYYDGTRDALYDVVERALTADGAVTPASDGLNTGTV
jgi:hypothetical protein